MRKMLLCLSLLMPVLSSLADELLPREVQRFIDRREGCDHIGCRKKHDSSDTANECSFHVDLGTPSAT